AEFRDRRKIFDIEAYSRQPFKAETVPGLEPQQRMPTSRPSTGFNDRSSRDNHSRDRKFGAPRTAGFGGNHAPREERAFEHRRGGNDSYAGKSGFNDRFSAPRSPGFAPRNEGFAPRNEGFAARADGAARPGNGGKVFVPRDAKKRPYKPAR
ncbi:MAG: ATP-dependent helicase, partial [Ramlibacter sp.]